MIIFDNRTITEILQRFREMRLPEMANQLLMMQETGELQTLSTVDILDRLTSEEMISRKNNTIHRYMKAAHMSQPGASLNELRITAERRINESVLKQLSGDDYILRRRNVIILGACGTGKSFLANALVSSAFSHLHTALYCRMFELLGDTNNERLLSGETTKTIRKYVKPEVLVIDDFMNTSLNEKESLDLFKILEYRNLNSTTIIASQLEPKEWYCIIANPILADSLLDRVTGGAYKLILSGESYRQEKKI